MYNRSLIRFYFFSNNSFEYFQKKQKELKLFKKELQKYRDYITQVFLKLQLFCIALNMQIFLFLKFCFVPSKFTLTNEDFGALNPLLLTNTSKVKVNKPTFSTRASYYGDQHDYLNYPEVYNNPKANKKKGNF